MPAKGLRRADNSDDGSLSSLKKRKSIPGPLGVLLKQGNEAVEKQQRKSEKSFSDESLNRNFSEGVTSFSEDDSAWNQVVKLFDSESWKVLCDFSVDRILRNAEKGFPRGKVPVLCAVIEKIDTSLPIAKVVLRDETGKIGCSIDKNVVQKYKKFLCSGAVLFLKQTSLFSLNQKTFYLNITLPNVARIFLDESVVDSRLAVVENVSLCGPSAPPLEPPLSLDEMRALVTECLTSPPLPPSAPIPTSVSTVDSRLRDRSMDSTPSPHGTPGSSCRPAGLRKKPLQPRRHPSNQTQPIPRSPPAQGDCNWRLNAGRAGLATASSSSSAVKAALSSTPTVSLQSRRGIRSLLKAVPGDPATPRPHPQLPSFAHSSTPGLIKAEEKTDSASATAKPKGNETSAKSQDRPSFSSESASALPSDWMEDDMDNLLASLVE